MKIKKIAQSVGLVGTITNDINDTNDNAVPNAKTVKEYVDKANTYSTNEIAIGTWLGQPLYRKVITGTLPTGEGVNTFTFPGYEIINYRGKIQSQYDTWFPLDTYYQAENGYSTYSYLNGAKDTLYIRCIDFYNTSSKYEIVLEYTKTTD